jgi:UDP-glucose 4-epimerase
MPAAPQRSCLVTGGAGFIGSHLVARLAGRGDHVTVVDDLSTGRRDNLDGIDPARLTVHEATVTEALPRLEAGTFDEIYHLAAAVGVRLVIEQPVHTIETNVLETSAVLNFAVEGGTPTLIASTSEVYGKSEKTPFAEDDDVVYGPTTLSRWSYACSKAIDEYLPWPATAATVCPW